MIKIVIISVDHFFNILILLIYVFFSILFLALYFGILKLRNRTSGASPLSVIRAHTHPAMLIIKHTFKFTTDAVLDIRTLTGRGIDN